MLRAGACIPLGAWGGQLSWGGSTFWAVFFLFSLACWLWEGAGAMKSVLRSEEAVTLCHGLGHARVVLQQQDTPVSIILVSITRFLDLDTHIQGAGAFAGGY